MCATPLQRDPQEFAGKNRTAHTKVVEVSSVNLDHIRSDLFQYPFHLLQNACSDIKEVLLFLHDGQVIVRRHRKGLQDLIQHFPVLPGNAYNGVQSVLDLSSLTRGHILMASGLVPKTTIIFFTGNPPYNL